MDGQRGDQNWPKPKSAEVEIGRSRIGRTRPRSSRARPAADWHAKMNVEVRAHWSDLSVQFTVVVQLDNDEAQL